VSIPGRMKATCYNDIVEKAKSSLEAIAMCRYCMDRIAHTPVFEVWVVELLQCTYDPPPLYTYYRAVVVSGGCTQMYTVNT
jgi:hypothetical protein